MNHSKRLATISENLVAAVRNVAEGLGLLKKVRFRQVRDLGEVNVFHNGSLAT